MAPSIKTASNRVTACQSSSRLCKLKAKRQLIKHKITPCFIILAAGFMGVRLETAPTLSSSCGRWGAGAGDESGHREGGGKMLRSRWGMKRKKRRWGEGKDTGSEPGLTVGRTCCLLGKSPGLPRKN